MLSDEEIAELLSWELKYVRTAVGDLFERIQEVARAAYERGKEDASPTRADTEAAIRAAWSYFGSVEQITGKLFGEKA